MRTRCYAVKHFQMDLEHKIERPYLLTVSCTMYELGWCFRLNSNKKKEWETQKISTPFCNRRKINAKRTRAQEEMKTNSNPTGITDHPASFTRERNQLHAEQGVPFAMNSFTLHSFATLISGERATSTGPTCALVPVQKTVASTEHVHNTWACGGIRSNLCH